MTCNLFSLSVNFQVLNGLYCGRWNRVTDVSFLKLYGKQLWFAILVFKKYVLLVPRSIILIFTIVHTNGSMQVANILLVTGSMQVASWGAYMLKRNVLTMSFAPRDSHEAQVQFALERGVPAVIGVLGTIKLPYPSRSFDMAQCSRCLISWTSNGELKK